MFLAYLLDILTNMVLVFLMLVDVVDILFFLIEMGDNKFAVLRGKHSQTAREGGQTTFFITHGDYTFAYPSGHDGDGDGDGDRKV